MVDELPEAPGPARAAALAYAHLDGILTPAEADELAALLTDDPAAAEAFVRVCYHDGLLAESFRDTYRLAPPRVRPDPPPRPRRPIKARLVRERRRPLALAAGVLLAVGVGYLGFGPAARRVPVASGPARLTQSIGCKWNGAVPPSEGDLKPDDRFKLAEGTAEFRFANGVRVAAQAGTDLTVRDGGRVQLTAGTLTADVPPAGVGFGVETPAGDVVDLGTWFQVRVDKTGPVVVEVYEGAVDVRPTGGTPAEVKAPESVRFTAAGVTPNGVTIRPALRRLFPGIVYSEHQLQPVSIPPAVVGPLAFPKNRVSVLQERTDHVLTRDLSAGPFRKGEYLAGPPADAAVRRGTRVHSYLFHTGPGSAEGRVEFAAPILGVIRTGAGLAASDDELTATKFEGWPADARGLDAIPADNPGENSLWLNPNRKGLWVRRSAAKGDEFRVLLDAEE